MSELLGSFELISPAEPPSLRVELHRNIEADHLALIERDWNPPLRRLSGLALIDVKSQGIQDPDEATRVLQASLQACGAPDGHWDWRQKAAGIAQQPAFASFVVTCGDHVEAAMICDLRRDARIVSRSRMHLAYVDYLAVAPWNREQIQSPRKLRGLGQLMLATAISLSINEGFEGRVALHSLTQSEGFYRACGMTDLGTDASLQDMCYFEFTADQANAFLALQD